jgi:threonine dehydratase
MEWLLLVLIKFAMLSNWLTMMGESETSFYGIVLLPCVIYQRRLTFIDSCYCSRVILEPAGALAVAGLKKYVEENNITGSTFVAITSGANMDFNRLRVVSERADDSERSLQITIPETPGSFREMYSKIWPRNVTEFSYRYETHQEANIFVSFQPLAHVENDFESVMDELKQSNFECSDISNNELAKTHIRHLAGGRSGCSFERLFRFHFPESPGALQRFLEALNMKWNISLFHYRNYGDDFGRVLVGIQQTQGEHCEGMNRFLQELGYQYIEETNNPAYNKFLRTSPMDS